MTSHTTPWLVGGLGLLATLALMWWQRSLDRGAETEGRYVAAAVPATKRARQDDQERRPERTSKPVSRASDSRDESELGQVEPSWHAAVGLPKQVRNELRNSDDPLSHELLRRNSQLTLQTADDGWGLDMQERLNEFFESRSQEKGEAESLLVTVACRGLQCQVQIVSLVQPAAGSTPLSEVLFDELNRHWWFREQLAMAQSHVTTVDGRRYHLQYFDRRS